MPQITLNFTQPQVDRMIPAVQAYFKLQAPPTMTDATEFIKDLCRKQVLWYERDNAIKQLPPLDPFDPT